jgi:hypothetical protein
MKLMIREDGDMVRAFFARMDGTGKMEIATLSTAIAQKCPGIFDRWKDMISDATAEALTQCGFTVKAMAEIKAHTKN